MSFLPSLGCLLDVLELSEVLLLLDTAWPSGIAAQSCPGELSTKKVESQNARKRVKLIFFKEADSHVQESSNTDIQGTKFLAITPKYCKIETFVEEDVPSSSAARCALAAI